MEIAVDGLDDVDLLVINLTSRNSAMMSKWFAGAESCETH